MSSIKTHSASEIGTSANVKRLSIGIGLGLLSAILLIFAFQPYSIWPLAFIAYVPMLVGAHRVLPSRWSGLAPGIGLGLFLAIFLTSLFGSHKALWIFLLIAGLIALITVLSTPKARAFHIQTGYRWFILQGAVEAAGIEFGRSFIRPLDTHAFFAQTVYTQPWLLQPISIFGTYGLTALIILVNLTLTLAAIRLVDSNLTWVSVPKIEKQMAKRWYIISGIVLIAWISISGLIMLTEPKPSENQETVRVAAVQHGFTLPGHQDPDHQSERLAALTAQTHIAAEQGAQLVVWPELGLGFDPQEDHTAELQQLTARTNIYLLIGYAVDAAEGWRNEAVLLTPEGDFLEVYGKNYPSIPTEPRIVSSGVYPIYETVLGNIATIICNDINFPASTRTLAQKGARLITVPTYESGAPGLGWEQRTQVVLRAVQNRVAVIKADNAGISMVIDPYGRILAEVDISSNEPYALVADVPLGSGNTLYNRLGDWTGWLGLLGLIIFSVATHKKQAGGSK